MEGELTTDGDLYGMILILGIFYLAIGITLAINWRKKQLEHWKFHQAQRAPSNGEILIKTIARATFWLLILMSDGVDWSAERIVAGWRWWHRPFGAKTHQRTVRTN